MFPSGIRARYKSDSELRRSFAKILTWIVQSDAGVQKRAGSKARSAAATSWPDAVRTVSTIEAEARA
jgi:hypothetical protein